MILLNAGGRRGRLSSAFIYLLLAIISQKSDNMSKTEKYGEEVRWVGSRNERKQS